MKQISYIRKLGDAIGKSLPEKLQLAVDDEAGEACGLVRVEDVASYQAIAVPADSNPALISASSSKPFRCSNLEARTEDSINEIPAAKVALLLAKDDEGYIGNRPERCDAAQGPPLRIEQFASLSIEHASSPFYDTAKVAQNRAAINGFLNALTLFLVPFQHVSSHRRRVLIFLVDPLEIEKSRK